MQVPRTDGEQQRRHQADQRAHQRAAQEEHRQHGGEPHNAAVRRTAISVGPSTAIGSMAE